MNALGNALKSLGKINLDDLETGIIIGSIQTSVFLKTRILKGILEYRKTCWHLVSWNEYQLLQIWKLVNSNI